MKFELPDLHRSGARPQWEDVPEVDRNPYQIRAAATHGIDTPGNRETLKGDVATGAGIYCIDKGAIASGTALIAYGRWKDIRDGQRAAETETKQPLGETFDAVSDSLLLATALPVFERQDIISKAEQRAITYLTIAKMVAAGTAKLTGRELHAERINKLSMFFMWGGLGTHLLAKNIEKYYNQPNGQAVDKAGKAMTYLGIGLGAAGMLGYLRGAFATKKR